MLGYVNWRMRVTIADGRVLLGTFMAFDKHMNLVLSDTEEYRRVKGKKGECTHIYTSPHRVTPHQHSTARAK